MNSISFSEFRKLQNPSIPEKFRLIYELLYYLTGDPEEVTQLTGDKLWVDEGGQGRITFPSGKQVKLNDSMFNRLTTYLRFENKPWGGPEAITIGKRNKAINYIFESHRKGKAYTIPTLYKKFKEHCQRAGILRDLTLGSLTDASIGRTASILNQEKEQLETILFAIHSNEELVSGLRYYLLHQNYEEVCYYKRKHMEMGMIDTYRYSNLRFKVFQFDTIPDVEGLIAILPELSKNQIPPVYFFSKPSSLEIPMVTKLVRLLHSNALETCLSVVVDQVASDKELGPITSVIGSQLRPCLKFAPLKLEGFATISAWNTIVDFFNTLSAFYN